MTVPAGDFGCGVPKGGLKRTVEKIGIGSRHENCRFPVWVGHQEVAATRHASDEHGFWTRHPRTDAVVKPAVTRLWVYRPAHRARAPKPHHRCLDGTQDRGEHRTGGSGGGVPLGTRQLSVQPGPGARSRR